DLAEYNVLVQELVPEEKKLIQEPGGEINIKKSKEKDYKEMRKVKETATQNRGRVEEPTKDTFDRIYKPAKVDYANGIKDPKDSRTRIRIEKDIEEGENQDKTLKVEVKDARALEHQG
ncbi:10848_t:CDS:2, partial [Gigaspora rosea]